MRGPMDEEAAREREFDEQNSFAAQLELPETWKKLKAEYDLRCGLAVDWTTIYQATNGSESCRGYLAGVLTSIAFERDVTAKLERITEAVRRGWKKFKAKPEASKPEISDSQRPDAHGHTSDVDATKVHREEEEQGQQAYKTAEAKDEAGGRRSSEGKQETVAMQQGTRTEQGDDRGSAAATRVAASADDKDPTLKIRRC